MYAAVYERFRGLTGDIFVQGGNASFTDVKRHPDIITGRGPIGAVYSALHHARNPKVFIIACDMPEVEPTMLNILRCYEGYDAVVPRWRNGYLEPLCAIYSRTLMPVIEAMLDKGTLRVSGLYVLANTVKFVDIDALIERGTIARSCFRNVNIPEDADSVTRAWDAK